VPAPPTLGLPRLHLREVGSTSDRARELAEAGAPHGTLVTTGHQVAGRGRQGRTWTTPAGRALTMSLVLHDPEPLLPIRAGVAVSDAIGPAAAIKWPNDILLDGRKVAGILAEARPQAGWAVLGVGVNVALREDDLPAELRGRAGTLGRAPEDVEVLLIAVLEALATRLAQPAAEVLAAWRTRDALAGRAIRWHEGAGEGTAHGIDEDGRLVVRGAYGARAVLDAGEVHLTAG
jgi:BirA family transcriptional regulator, biotin operon repressor / biotin---[acetyl-CoA-carboxylase] ligase